MNHKLRYILIAKDCVTDKTFWLFEKTDQFQELMSIWEANSPKRNQGCFYFAKKVGM